MTFPPLILRYLQAESIEASLSGKSVVISTMTSSGKSLCYNLPVLEVLSQNTSACALYLFPTKVHFNFYLMLMPQSLVWFICARFNQNKVHAGVGTRSIKIIAIYDRRFRCKFERRNL